jgi:hypothetical protein
MTIETKGKRREIRLKTPSRTFLLPSALSRPPDRKCDQATGEQ